MSRLCVDTLRKVASTKGDTSGYAIHKRTGVAESSVYRILKQEAQPDLNSILRFARAYGVSVEHLMTETDDDTDIDADQGIEVTV
jgi:DNA-binding phage protein